MDKNKRYIGHFDQLSLVEAREQLSFLHQHGVVYFWLHVLSATLLCTFLWFKVDVSTVLTVIWYAAIVLLAVGCWIIISRFSRSHRMTQEQLIEATQQYRFISVLLCTVWGISGIILFCEVPAGQAVHVCLLLVITFSIWPILVISRVEFYLQLGLLLLPITLMLAFQNDLKTSLLCIVILAFAGMTFLVTRLFSQIMDHLFGMQRSLTEQVHTDPVTQLINRSHFDQTFKNEWQRSAREGRPLSLLLIEIDHFQQIEIEGGTSAGEQYLRVVTHCLKLIARRGSDILARYGRAEFVALLPGTSLEGATNLAERLRLEIERAQMTKPLEDGSPVSVTVGVSSCIPTVNPSYRHPAHHKQNSEEEPILYPAALLSMADRALQRAKNKGQNQVGLQAAGENAVLTTVYQNEAYPV